MVFPSQRPPAARSVSPWLRPAWLTSAGLSALVAVFFLLGWPLVRMMGIEVDEALIGNGLYQRASTWYSWRFAGNEIPVMVNTYLGALKIWLLNPILAIWPPSPVSLRVPTLIIGAITIVLFFRLLDGTLGRRAAWVGTSLLAVDPSYILTEAIDFGPVALDHVLKLSAVLLLLSYHRRPALWKLQAAFFLLGLAMWDKAVFIWILAGLVAASFVFWREVRQHLSWRSLALAAMAFLIGALPLVVYNAKRGLETVTSNVHLAPDNSNIKLIVAMRTLNGSGAFGYFTAPDEGLSSGAAHGAGERASFAVARLFDEPRTSWLAWAFGLSLLGVPLIWRTPARRPVLASLVVIGVGWLLMFFTNGAGGAIHHIVLLWPFHLLVIAAVFCTLAQRLGRYAVPALTLATALLCASDLLVMNSYYVNLMRNGPGVRWTDAFTPLANWLYHAKSPRIVIVDWGILETLNLMSEGELPVEDASAALQRMNDAPSQAAVARLLESPGAVFVAHREAYEQLPGCQDQLLKFAASRGYSQELLQTVQDRNGRPIFDIFRFRRPG